MTKDIDIKKNLKENDFVVISKKLDSSLSALNQNNLGVSLKNLEPLIELKDAMKAIQIADPLKDLRETMKAIQLADPLKELRETMKAIQMADPLKKIREIIKALQIADPLKALREAINTIQVVDPLKGLRESIKAIQMADPLKEFRELLNSQNAHYINEIKIQFSNLNRSIDVYKNIFSGSLPKTSFELAYQEVISKVIIAKKENNVEGALSKVADEIVKDTSQVSISPLSMEFYLNFLIAFIFFIYSMHLSTESENRIISQVKNSQTVIMEKLDIITSIQDTNTYYVVIRAVNMRIKPTTKKSQIINVLYPNQTVKLIERKGKWIKVEYYNHVLGVHENGWCYKKYLKISKNPNTKINKDMLTILPNQVF